jgi:hypothetical protein
VLRARRWALIRYAVVLRILQHLRLVCSEKRRRPDGSHLFVAVIRWMNPIFAKIVLRQEACIACQQALL